MPFEAFTIRNGCSTPYAYICNELGSVFGSRPAANNCEAGTRTQPSRSTLIFTPGCAARSNCFCWVLLDVGVLRPFSGSFREMLPEATAPFNCASVAGGRTKLPARCVPSLEPWYAGAATALNASGVKVEADTITGTEP